MLKIDLKPTGKIPALALFGTLRPYEERMLRDAGAIFRSSRTAWMRPEETELFRSRSHYELPAALIGKWFERYVPTSLQASADGKWLMSIAGRTWATEILPRAEVFITEWLEFEGVLRGLKKNSEEQIGADFCDAGITDDFFARPPLPHQKAGLAMFLESYAIGAGHILLFDEMRTGKTKQAIDIANYLLREKLINAVLIICPNTIKQVWLNELKLDSPLYSCLTVIINGTKAKKKKQWESKNYFYIVNYEACRADPQALHIWQEFHSIDGWLLICDEAHKLKNPMSKQSQIVCKLRPDYSVLMTGTPVANRPEDIWSMANFVCPGILGSRLTDFQERFGIRGGYKGREITGYQDLDVVKSRLARISMRRLRKDVVFDQTIRQQWTGKLAGKQAKAYETMRLELQAELTNEAGDWTAVKARNNLVRVLRLQQISNGYLSSEAGDVVWFDENWKLRELDSFVEDYLDSIGKLVIWTRYVPVIYKLAERYKKYGSLYIRGQMGNQAIENMYTFQRDPAARILVAQIQTSEGKGFQPATFCVFYDKWWSPHLNQQAEDRIVGIKNPVPVTSISLVTEGTIDERLEYILEKKRGWGDSITGDKPEAILLPPALDRQTLLYLVANPEEARGYEE